MRAFYEDLYLFDLNRLDLPAQAHRSAQSGCSQPLLHTLIGVSARDWSPIAQQLYERSVYLSANGGAVLLPMIGSVGRFVLVIKVSLSASAMSYLAACAGQEQIYIDQIIQDTPPRVRVSEREVVESIRGTIAELRLLIRACESAHCAADAAQCVEQAAELMGVTLMLSETAEQAPVRTQGVLPDMRPSGQALFVSALTLLSVMRNTAHARSGWLYVTPQEQGYVLQAALRCAEDADLSALAHLHQQLDDSGVPLDALTSVAPVKPPKQYAYLHRKITDPHKPLCARCACLDKRCASCTITRWAVLPYVCDAALLGIKAQPYFFPEEFGKQ